MICRSRSGVTGARMRSRSTAPAPHFVWDSISLLPLGSDEDAARPLVLSAPNWVPVVEPSSCLGFSRERHAASFTSFVRGRPPVLNLSRSALCRLSRQALHFTSSIFARTCREGWITHRGCWMSINREESFIKVLEGELVGTTFCFVFI